MTTIIDNPTERELIDGFRALDDSGRAAVLGLVRADGAAEARLVALEALEELDGARKLLASLLERQP